MKTFTSNALLAAVCMFLCVPALAQTIFHQSAAKNISTSFDMPRIEHASPFVSPKHDVPECLKQSRSVTDIRKASSSADTGFWGDWFDLASATYTHGSSQYLISGSEQSFKTMLQIRYNLMYDNLFQIRVPEVFSGKDIIFTWEQNNDLSTNSIDAQSIALSYTFDGYEDMEFQSISIANGTYNQAKGLLSFNVWYSLNDVNGAVYGYSVRDKIELDNMPDYKFDVSFGKQLYKQNENKATFNFSVSDNIKAVRYYAEPSSDTDFAKNYSTLKETEFITKNFVTVDAGVGTITVDIAGYSPYDVYFQAISSDGKVVEYEDIMIFSTQSDNRNWESLGTGVFYDKDIRELFESEDGYAHWQVEVQRCVDDISLYRLVNPYTTAECPYIGKPLTDAFANAYDMEYDTSQNYYLYFHADNMQSGANVVSYCYPSGISLTERSSGEQYACFLYNFDEMTEDCLVSNSNDMVRFAFPQYIDYSFTLTCDDDNIVRVIPASENSTYVYQITSSDGTYVSDAKDVSGDLKIDLSAENLSGVGDYTLSVYGHSTNGEVQHTETYKFSVGVSAWQYVGKGTATYRAYTSGTEALEIYKRYELENPEHEQYQLRKWLYGVTDLIVDVADKDTFDSNNHVVVTVPVNSTKYVFGNYGNIRITDVYTYIENDNYYNDSYYIPSLGEFHLSNVYYVDGGYLGYDVETFKIDGYPALSIVNGGKAVIDGVNTQTVTVNMSNVAYVKYGLFDSDYYTAGIAAAELERTESAARISSPTTLTFNEVGDYIFVAVAYDSDDNILEVENMKFMLREAIDMSSWSYIGKSTFVDGWILPIYSIDGSSMVNTDHPWQVDTYVSLDNPSVVGLYNPYRADGCVLRNFNFDPTNDVMVTIDLSVDGFVSIPTQESGYVDATYGMIKISNLEGFYGTMIDDKDRLKNALLANNYELTTQTESDENTLITIPQGLYSVSGSVYYATQPTYITIPRQIASSANIISIDAKAPAEYYNLQGVRVLKPGRGVYIRKRGSVVSKVVL